MSSPLRLTSRAWCWWKSLRLPWRKRFLIGHDLRGNTYWEFRLTRSGLARGHDSSPHDHQHGWRRIVHYPRSTHYSDVEVSPLWHQWLRHVRQHPPSIAEQHQDLARLARIRQLAAQVDARREADALPPQSATRPPLASSAPTNEAKAPVLETAAEHLGQGSQPESWTPSLPSRRS